jgi:phosphatidylglycerol:prolipoprotein diacylglycerol transferase
VHPVLVELGRLRIYSYGFMLAFSFFVGIWYAGRRAESRGIPKETIQDLSIILILFAVLGSRVLYILTHRDRYHSLLDIIALWEGGATYYGGLALAVAGAVAYLKRKKIGFFKVADICSPPIALGIVFTRIGCFLSGCCFGSPTGCPLGVVFPVDSPAGYMFEGQAVHPAQLYSSFYGLVILAALLLVERKRSFDGFTFSFLCIFYGMARFAVDFFRYYEEAAVFGGHLTYNQVISIGLAALGLSLLLVLPKRRSR